jgi:hypothetical protein
MVATSTKWWRMQCGIEPVFDEFTDATVYRNNPYSCTEIWFRRPCEATSLARASQQTSSSREIQARSSRRGLSVSPRGDSSQAHAADERAKPPSLARGSQRRVRARSKARSSRAVVAPNLTRGDERRGSQQTSGSREIQSPIFSARSERVFTWGFVPKLRLLAVRSVGEIQSPIFSGRSQSHAVAVHGEPSGSREIPKPDLSRDRFADQLEPERRGAVLRNAARAGRVIAGDGMCTSAFGDAVDGTRARIQRRSSRS